MVQPYTRPTTNQQIRPMAKDVDRLLRQRTDVPSQLNDLDGVTAFKMAHRQRLTFNKYTGVWEPVNATDIEYGWTDPPASATNTFAYAFRDDYNLVGASFVARVTGTSSSIAKLQKNGTTFLTLTLGSGVQIVTATVSPVGFAANTDILTVLLDTAGTGALGLGGAIWRN